MKIGNIGKLLLGILSLLSLDCAAEDWSVTGYVTSIDATGFGARSDDGLGWAPLIFTISTAIPNNACGVGANQTAKLIYYSPPFNNVAGGQLDHPTGNDRRLANMRAQLTQLQLAIAAGLPVRVGGYIGGTGFCTLAAIELRSN